MMNYKTSLKSLVDFLGSSCKIRESIERVEISGIVPKEQVKPVIEIVTSVSGESGWTVEIRNSEYDPIEPCDITPGDIDLIITKPIGGRIFFVSSAGFFGSLDRAELSDAKTIFLLGSFQEFSSRRFRVCKWDGIPLRGISANTELDELNPRRGIVRDLTSKLVPEDPYRWLLVGGQGDGPIWDQWQLEAINKLSLVVVSEVWQQGDNYKVALEGARRRVFSYGKPPANSSCFKSLAQVVEWMLVRQDAEARHEVLVRRLAALIPESLPPESEWIEVFCNVLEEALAGARLDHRAYIRSKSAEAVKAMAELRKSVMEDVARIVERSHRLANGFVAALATLAVTFGIRLGIIAGGKGGKDLAFIFAIVVLIVTWAAFLAQNKVGTKSLLDEIRHTRRWHRDIHSSLSRKEYMELAKRPIIDAITLYHYTARWTWNGLYVASVLFIFVLIIFP